MTPIAATRPAVRSPSAACRTTCGPTDWRTRIERRPTARRRRAASAAGRRPARLLLLGWRTSPTPVSHRHRALADAADRRATAGCATRVRRAILEQATRRLSAFLLSQAHKTFPLGDPPDYEPPPEASVARHSRVERSAGDRGRLRRPARGRRAGAAATCRSWATRTATSRPATRCSRRRARCSGLGDGGADCGLLCDASLPSDMPAMGTRPHRRPRRGSSRRSDAGRAGPTAHGFADRGTLAPATWPTSTSSTSTPLDPGAEPCTTPPAVAPRAASHGYGSTVARPGRATSDDHGHRRAPRRPGARPPAALTHTRRPQCESARIRPRRTTVPSGVSSTVQPSASSRSRRDRRRPSPWRRGPRRARRPRRRRRRGPRRRRRRERRDRAQRRSAQDGGGERRGRSLVAGVERGVGRAHQVEQEGDGPRRVEVVVHRRAEGVERRRVGRRPVERRDAAGERVEPARRRPSASRSDVVADVHRRAVVRAQDEQAEGPRVVRLDQVDEVAHVAERLRHLLAVDLDACRCGTSARRTRARRPTAWARSFSWCGKRRSWPPPWMSKPSPSRSSDITTHSVCQPGRPGPQGESHVGSPGLAFFQRTKSTGLRFSSSASTRAPGLQRVDRLAGEQAVVRRPLGLEVDAVARSRRRRRASTSRSMSATICST